MGEEVHDHDYPVSVVFGASTPLTDEILIQLKSRGHAPASIGGAGDDRGARLDQSESVEACFADVCGGRCIDILIHVDVPLGATRLEPLMNLDLDEWDARCESIIRSTLLVLQAAHRRLGDGGSIVLVLPSISLAGAAGLAAWSAAAESQRILAKEAARRWGAEGIRVNVILVPPALFGAEPEGEPLASAPVASSALGEAASTPEAVANLVCMLVGADARTLTGATLVADGGSVMVP